MGYGASYFKNDPEAAQWAQIAGMAQEMGKYFEKEQISSAYETLRNGGKLPDDTRDSIKLGAKKMLADNMEGETIAAEQNIMGDVAAKAKEQNLDFNSYFKKNVDSYMTNPANLRAVSNISKKMQERQLADAVYQKARLEEGKLKYDEVSSLAIAAKDLYDKGDYDGATSMVEQLSKTVPVPGYLSRNKDSGKLEGYTTDFSKGGHKPVGQYDLKGTIDALNSVTRDEFALGYAINSHVVREKNAENLANATVMTGKDGGRYFGFNFVDPYNATDTKFIVKKYGTGEDVGRFSSMHDAVDKGFTVYNQKYEQGELAMQNMRDDQVMQKAEHGARMQSYGADALLKKLNIEDKQADMEFQKEIRPYQIEKTKNEASEAGAKARGESTKDYVKGLDETFKVLGEAGIEATPEISSLVRELPRNMTPAERAQYTKIAMSKTDPITDPVQKKKAIEEMIAAAHGIPAEIYSIRKQYPGATTEKLQGIIKAKSKESRRKVAEDEAAKSRDTATKASIPIFRDISKAFDDLKSNATIKGSDGQMIDVYTGRPITDDELWIKAAQDPMFGKGLYDIRNTYFKDKTPDEMLGLVKQWHASMKDEEARKKLAEDTAEAQKEVAKRDKSSFYRFGR